MNGDAVPHFWAKAVKRQCITLLFFSASAHNQGTHMLKSGCIHHPGSLINCVEQNPYYSVLAKLCEQKINLHGANPLRFQGPFVTVA